MSLRIKVGVFLLIFTCAVSVLAQKTYWNQHTMLTPWRLPIVSDLQKIQYLDLNKDGRPDVIKSEILDGIPIIWIDDDQNMKTGDVEGDQINDCLLVDLNKDGKFAGPNDLSIDWIDSNNDGVADIQLIVSNGSLDSRNFFDFQSDYMYIIDYNENDGIQNYINWNKIVLMAWEHSGLSNFYSDYHGNTLFLKTHASSFRVNDLKYNWENPFIFYDFDRDQLSEMAIRLVDTPVFRPKNLPSDTTFNQLDQGIDIKFTGKVDWASIAWDMDNDNGSNNEFDFDMSLRFSGKGFDYGQCRHKFKNMRGLKEADSLFFDPRWRRITELIYTAENEAYTKIYKYGKWNNCWFIFDEDDDCNRWERVEFYEPKNLWKIGMRKGGVDNNGQADAIGDRGEFDMDFSGAGKLYVSPFDGKIHLYGAEWGIWRIDMNTVAYQGYGGQYPPSKNSERLTKDPEKWATIKYTDTNSNGFFDCIEYDLDGDTIFEEKIQLRDLGIDDKARLIDPANYSYQQMSKFHLTVTTQTWERAQKVIRLAESLNVSTSWYNFYKHPKTLSEKLNYGYWIVYYLYKDMCHVALLKNNTALKVKLDKAYYSGNWNNIN